MIVQHGLSGRTLRGCNDGEDFQVQAAARQVLASPGGPGTTALQDTVWDLQAGATYDDAFELTVETRLDASLNTFDFTNHTPEIGTLTGQTLSRLADGTAQIQVQHGSTKRLVNLPLARHSGAVYLQGFNRHADGSLALALDTAFHAAVNGKTPGAASQRLLNSASQRNAAHFLAGYDLSGIVGWVNATEYDNFAHGITLVSPRHAICAHHFTPWQVTCTWLDNSQAAHSAKIVGNVKVANDINVVMLDRDIPCKAYKLLPADAGRYLPPPNTAIPGLFTALGAEAAQFHGLNKSAWLADWSLAGGLVYGRQPATADRQPWYAPLYHSGSPFFLALGGELVLSAVWWVAGQSGAASENYVLGNALHLSIAEINAAMAALTATHNPGGTAYAVQTANLTPYASY